MKTLGVILLIFYLLALARSISNFNINLEALEKTSELIYQDDNTKLDIIKNYPWVLKISMIFGYIIQLLTIIFIGVATSGL